MVNKLPQNLDNPIDNILNNIVDTQLNYYKQLNLTPNILTTISLLLGLLTSYYAYNDKYIIASILYLLSYYFDCADGKMARKFKMTSKFGDFYDHASDIIKNIILYYILYNKLNETNNNNIKLLIIVILIIIFILTLSHLGCQEKIYRNNKKSESSTLNITEKFIFMDCNEQVKYTRYFGPATINVYIILVLLYLAYKN